MKLLPLYVIEETIRKDYNKLVRSHMETGRILCFEDYKEAQEWKDVLDKARGQKSDNPDFLKSVFRVIKLRED